MMGTEPTMNDVRPPPAVASAMTLPELIQLATQLQVAGRSDAAVQTYADWVARNDSPLRVVALFNQGALLGGLNREAEALACYENALALNRAFAPAWLNLGHGRERAGRPDDALTCWKEVYEGVASAGGTSEEHRLHALNQSARLLEQLKRYPEAEALMRRSLEIKPAQFDVIQHYVHIRQKQCAWPLYAPVGDVTPNQFLMGTSALAAMGIHDDPAIQLLAATRFVHEKLPKAAARALHLDGPKRQGKVRIGYLSGDLHHHAVGLLTAELFELHDRSRFDIHAFCWTPESTSPVRQRIRAAIDHLTPIGGVDDATAAKLIAQAGIDVLVDLQGLTSGARPAILGHRPAPVQIGYLGLPGTSAIPGLDWMIADRYVMPRNWRLSARKSPSFCRIAIRSATVKGP